MSKTFNRRDILKLVGGGMAGMAFTPIPWKLIDDLSIWTQNWSWMPIPLKGEINSKYSICTICPAGCAIRARCVKGQPVSLWGIKDHPVNGGALCPPGLGGHHLPYHPARLRYPVKLINDNNKIKTGKITRDEIVSLIAKNVSAIKSNGSNEVAAILDSRQDRTISYAYRKFLSGIPNGLYITTGSDGADSLLGFREITSDTVGPVGYNIEKAKTIVSFGAPLLEGWGVPGRILGAMKNGSSSPNNKQFKLIQIETRFSHTASVADRWIPVKPGTEAIFALGIAHILLQDNLIDTTKLRHQLKDYESEIDKYKKLTAGYTPQRVAEATGIREELVHSVARDIAINSPALIVCGREPAGGPFSREEQIAIWGLNFLLGNVGADNLIVPRRSVPIGESFQNTELAAVSTLSEIPERSIRVLIIDEAESGNAIPWRMIEQKLIPDKSVVISLSPYLVGLTKRADYVVPAPTHLESYQDIPPSFDARTATYAVSAPLLSPPDTVTEPVEFLKSIAEKLDIEMPRKTYTELINERAGEIYKKNRGWVYTPQNGRLIESAGILTERQFWSNLNNGGYWIDEPDNDREITAMTLFGSFVGQNKLRDALRKREHPSKSRKTKYPVTLVPFGWRGVVDSGPVTPLITKLYQETEFREGTNRALIHPDTARSYRLRDGFPAKITAESGELTVQIEFNDSVMPDVVHVALGPDQDSITGVNEVRIENNVLSICTLNENGNWRVTLIQIQTV